MHNGNIGSWKNIKRRLAASLSDQRFLGVQGSTDSEWAFALFLDSMERAGHNPNVDPGENGFGHAVLRKAVLETIKRINAFIAEVSPRDSAEDDGNEGDADTRSLLNFAVTDGYSVVCTRYVSSTTDEAASLYFSSGTNWKQDGPKGNYKMERRDKGADIVLVASEPLTFERDNWVTVPTNSTLTIHKQTVMIHPIVDQYYNPSPSYERKMAFAVSKGLVSNAPGVAQSLTPTTVPGTDAARQTEEVVDVVKRKLEEIQLRSGGGDGERREGRRAGCC
ncbi:MAG: hypothetical protein MMC33_009737 [Icmadophila ericetorum]|nr:hypothetical protein [Icmadophila ericetorum]